MEEYDVTIVGGGVAGSVAARFIAQEGFKSARCHMASLCGFLLPIPIPLIARIDMVNLNPAPGRPECPFARASMLGLVAEFWLKNAPRVFFQVVSL